MVHGYTSSTFPSPSAMSPSISLFVSFFFVATPPSPSHLTAVVRLLHYTSIMPPFDDSVRVDSNQVMGCTVRVWVEED